VSVMEPPPDWPESERGQFAPGLFFLGSFVGRLFGEWTMWGNLFGILRAHRAS